MGVDYTAHYGIGIQVEPIDFEDENLDQEIKDLEVMAEFLDEKLNGDKYSWFEVGSEDYTGQENDYYVEINNPFEKSYNNLENDREDLLGHLREIGLKPVGKFGLIGGLQVW